MTRASRPGSTSSTGFKGRTGSRPRASRRNPGTGAPPTRSRRTPSTWRPSQRNGAERARRGQPPPWPRPGGPGSRTSDTMAAPRATSRRREPARTRPVATSAPSSGRPTRRGWRVRCPRSRRPWPSTRSRPGSMSAGCATSTASTSRGSTLRASPPGCGGGRRGSAFHGSPAGGLLRVHDRATGKDLLQGDAFARGGRSVPGAARPDRSRRAGDGAPAATSCVSRSGSAGNRRRTDGVIAAVQEPLRALRTAVIAPASSAVSTAFDRQSLLEVTTSGSIRWTAQLADRTVGGVGGDVDHELRATDEGQLEPRAVRRGALRAGRVVPAPGAGPGRGRGGHQDRALR